MEEKGEKMEVAGMGREDGLERLMAGMERRKGWDGEARGVSRVKGAVERGGYWEVGNGHGNGLGSGGKWRGSVGEEEEGRDQQASGNNNQLSILSKQTNKQ